MNKFSILWLMRDVERSFDENSRCGYWMHELNSDWKVKCICDTKKLRNPAFIEVHRKSLDGERIITGTLETCEGGLDCHLKKKFVCLLEDGCLFTRFDFQYSRDAAKPPKQFLVTGAITISTRTEDSFDLSELAHLTNTSYSSLRQLSNDMDKLLLEKPFADVILKCGADSIPAHKSILSARSPVFEAMFSCPIEEAMENEVVIKDIEVADLRSMLRYIYTGTTEDLAPSLATNLLFVANKYKIAGLGSACSKHLMRTISMKNVVTVLEVGDSVSADLKNFAIDFLRNKCSSYTALEKRKDWIDLKNKNPSLALEVFSAVVKFQEQKLKGV